MEEVQLVAQRVHDDSQSSQHQLGVAESRVNELLMTVSQQAEQLEAQRREQTGMTQMILELQHQVTLLRQSSTPAQDQNATAIDMSPIMKEMQSRRNELALMKQTPSLNYPVFPMTRSVSNPIGLRRYSPWIATASDSEIRARLLVHFDADTSPTASRI